MFSEVISGWMALEVLKSTRNIPMLWPGESCLNGPLGIFEMEATSKEPKLVDKVGKDTS